MSRTQAILLVALMTSWAGPAWAAACCTSATVFGVGRLLMWEDAAAGVQLGAANGLGRWSPDGAWRPLGENRRELELSASAWTIVRLGQRWEAQARVPFLVNLRRSDEVSAVGVGAGDVLAGLRYELVSIGEYLELPAVAFTVGVLAPTARREEASQLPLGADATGRGVWEGSASVALEQTWSRWFLRLDAGGRASLPFRRSDRATSQRYGPGLTLALSGGRELRPGLTAALLVQHDREGRISVDGVPVENSSSWGLSASAAVSWLFRPHWTLQAAISSSAFASGWGSNRPGQLSTTWGIRYGHY